MQFRDEISISTRSFKSRPMTRAPHRHFPTILQHHKGKAALYKDNSYQKHNHDHLHKFLHINRQDASSNLPRSMIISLQQYHSTLTPPQNKLKVQLKLSIARLRMTQQKDTAIAKQTRRQMAQLVEEGKIESARIRVENIIRSDITTELNEILELYCELLIARSQLLDPPLSSPLSGVKGHKEEVHVDPGLEEAVRSIIYAAGQTGVKELNQARALLVEKFGKEFAISAMEGEGVAPRVLKKMKVETPPTELVDGYLREICRTYGVKLKLSGDPDSDVEEEEEEEGSDDDQPGSGGKIAELEDPLEAEELSKAKAPTDFVLSSPLRIAPPSPSTENVTPKLKLPEAAKRETKPKPKKTGTDKASKAGGDGPGGKIPNFDDLTARFAALKR